MNQLELNIIAPIKSGHRDQIEAIVKRLQKEFYAGEVMPFSSLGNTHFCRWVIFDAMIDGDVSYPERLFFESNFDGESQEKYLEQFCESSAALVDEIYANCEGFPEKENLNSFTRLAYISGHIHPTRVFFNGAPKRSVSRILKENHLRSEIRKFIDSNSFEEKTPIEVVQKIQNYISKSDELKWATESGPMPKTNWIALGIFGIIMLPFLPLVLLLLVALRLFYERSEIPLGLEPGEVDFDHMKELESNEDFCFQNQFSQMLVMKQTVVRKLLLQFNLTLTQFLGKTLFSKGLLLGIPTIHYARWIMLDNNKHMFFTSNFDGSWQQYLGDFIDKAGWGLNGIYSASEKFPTTFFLFFGGAYNEQQFLAWSRYFQVPTQFWYSAYPNISIKNINNNSIIRNELFKANTEKSAIKLLQRI